MSHARKKVPAEDNTLKTSAAVSHDMMPAGMPDRRISCHAFHENKYDIITWSVEKKTDGNA